MNHGSTRAYNTGCRCSECREVWNTYHRDRRKIRGREATRRSNLKQSHGITLEQYHEMLDEQHGVCASCGLLEEGCNQHGPVPLAVDHGHTTGKLRGLLCMRCNRALGMLRDDATVIENLLLYRRKYDNS